MGTSLIASLAAHHSIYRYVTSLLALKFRSSHREQIASLFTLSSSFLLLKQETTAFALLLGGLCPRACALLTQTSMASLGAGIPAPLARYHTIVICKGNHIKPPATRSPIQRFPSAKNLVKIPTYWKMFWYPLIKEGQLSHKYTIASLWSNAFTFGSLIEEGQWSHQIGNCARTLNSYTTSFKLQAIPTCKANKIWYQSLGSL